MSGTTADTNSAMMANKLFAIGHTIDRKVTIGDDFDLLVQEINQLSKESDVLIINGGLGPTVDDLTAKALGKASNRNLVEHPEALLHLKSWCKKLGVSLNDANLKQAILPEAIEILENLTGSAVGLKLTHNQCLILCTPGVPSELNTMLDVAVTPIIENSFPNPHKPFIDHLQCFGIGEATFQQKVNDTYPNWPKEVELSFRAGAPCLEIKLTTFRAEDDALKQKCKDDLYHLFGDYFIAEGKQSIAQMLVTLLQLNKKKITFAESCTGGLMASMITEVSGASTVFEAGFVTYSNSIKTSLLGVKTKTLEQFGAVSPQVAQEMLSGALAKSKADYGIAVSGIAGPEGGSEEKPVGTVCIAWGSLEENHQITLLMPRSRKMFQIMVAATGFDLVRRLILNIDSTPRYFARKLINGAKGEPK